MSGGDKERGHALIEVMLFGLLLLVPIVWMVTVLAELHAAALGATSAAREAGFEAARSVDVIAADDAVVRMVDSSIEAHGLDPGNLEVAWTTSGDWGRGDAVEVLVTYRVPVFQAPLLGDLSQPSIPVSARHVTTIDRYRSRGP